MQWKLNWCGNLFTNEQALFNMNNLGLKIWPNWMRASFSFTLTWFVFPWCLDLTSLSFKHSWMLKLIQIHTCSNDTSVEGYFMRVATCLWRCDFARPGFVLGRSTWNLTLGRINQWLPVYFWAYKIDKPKVLESW